MLIIVRLLTNNVFNVNNELQFQYISYCHNDICCSQVKHQDINWWCKRVQVFDSYLSGRDVSGQLVYFHDDDIFSKGYYWFCVDGYQRNYLSKCASPTVFFAGYQRMVYCFTH